MPKAMWLVVIAAAGIVAGVVIGQQVRPAAQASVQQPPFVYTGTVRDVMHMIVEPTSTALFDSVVTDITAAGIKETKPETDDQWDTLEHNAINLAEAANLIKMVGRPVARPDELNVDPQGPELPPAEIAKRIAQTRDAWVKHAETLQAAAEEALKYVRAKDVDGMSKVGETLDDACESCHLAYWYPEDKKDKK